MSVQELCTLFWSTACLGSHSAASQVAEEFVPGLFSGLLARCDGISSLTIFWFPPHVLGRRTVDSAVF